MGFVRKNLGRDEEILLEARHHHALWLKPIVLTLLFLIAGIAGLLGAFWLGSTEIPALGILGLAVTGWAGFNVIVWVFLIHDHLGAFLGGELVMTNRRLVRKYGFIRTELDELPLDKVETLTASQSSLLARLFNYGEISVSGLGGTFFTITHARDPMRFRRDALDVLDNTHAKVEVVNRVQVVEAPPVQLENPPRAS